jgi:bacteriocin-like protein
MNHDIGEVNHEACELSFEELEQVSGGWDLFSLAKAAASLADKVAHVLTGTN